MALGQPLGRSNKTQGRSGKQYLRPEINADRNVICHIWDSINDLHNRAMKGEVHVHNLDDFADLLKQDYGVNAEIIGEGNNFRFSQVGSTKTSTGAHLSRHIEKIQGDPEGTIQSITGEYICNQFGTEFARRSSLESPGQPSQQPNSVARPRQQRFSPPPVMLGDTEGFDDLSDDLLDDDLSDDDDGGEGGFIEDDVFAFVNDGEQQLTAAPSQSFSDLGEDDDLSEAPFTEGTSSQPVAQSAPAVEVEPPPANFGEPEQRPSDVVQRGRSSRNGRDFRPGRDPAESTLSDAASTFSGLANGNPDGVTLMADAGEVVAVAAAATMLGIEAVRQIQQSRDPDNWERLVALGHQIEATEKRGSQIAERIVKVEDTLAASRNGQAPEVDASQGQSSSDAAAESWAQDTADNVNGLNDRVSGLGQPDPNPERLRAPKIDPDAPIGKRLDALEAYLSKLNQKLDSIEERLEVLEEEAGITPQESDAVKGQQDGPQSASNQEPQFGQMVENKARPRRSRSPSQMQA